jgi:glucosyl-3-phosphoglycerate synthase
MADFQQSIVPTFPRLDTEDLARLEKSILRASRRTPVGVIVPALFTDLSSPAMKGIIAEFTGALHEEADHPLGHHELEQIR